MLFYAHSGVRYLVLLLGVLALLYFAYAAATRSGNERIGRILGSVFVGAMDLQALIGLLLVVTGTFYPALIGHLVMMIGAVAVGHFAMAMAKSSEDPHRAFAIRLLGVVFSLALIAGGIMAIGRQIFGTGVPSM